MSCKSEHFDVLVIGGGPAGQKAALHASHAGRSVLLVEKARGVGGECVHHGTIPSKTLRESALYLAGLKRRTSGLPGDLHVGPSTMVSSLMHRKDTVLAAYSGFITKHVIDSDIEYRRGRAAFASPTEVEILSFDGTCSIVEAGVILIATGSRPRQPPGIPVDHESVLDSDSILSMIYLPESLTVIGSGVIASEFASVFQALGVNVTMIDRAERPVGFLDAELTSRFVRAFESAGGRFVGGTEVAAVDLDSVGNVVTTVADGETYHAQKMLVAQGRTASVRGLNLEKAGLEPTQRGFIAVDGHLRTAVPHIYAIGDVIGPPALAAASVAQGRRAVCHALGLEPGGPPEEIPVGIYTIPEMASVGLDERRATENGGGCVVGRSSFEEIARGHINSATDGFLKLIADARGERLLGAQVVGEGAIELIHLAQMAMIGNLTVDAFIDNIFNFPTFAEAYRIAAIDIAQQRAMGLRQAG